MSTEQIQHVILELVVEDSFALSEIVDRIRQQNAQFVFEEALAAARSCVEHMLELGLIEVSRLDTPRGPESTVRGEDALTGVRDDSEWRRSTSWRSHLRIFATAAGRNVYYGRPLN